MSEEGFIEIDNVDNMYFNKNDLKNALNSIKHEKNTLILPLSEQKSPAEVCRIKQEMIDAFSYFDKENNGLINVTEFTELLNIIGNSGNLNVDDLFGRAQYDGSGYINYVEFVNAIIH